MHILLHVTDSCPTWISGRERMAVKMISWPISTKECCRARGSNLRPSACTSYQAWLSCIEQLVHIIWTTKALISLHGCAGWYVLLLWAYILTTLSWNSFSSCAEFESQWMWSKINFLYLLYCTSFYCFLMFNIKNIAMVLTKTWLGNTYIMYSAEVRVTSLGYKSSCGFQVYFFC